MAVEMTRYTVHYDRRHITLDEGTHIADKFICHIGSIFVQPLTRNEFLIICDLVDVFYFCAALVRIIGDPFEDHHFPGITLIRSFYRRSSYLEGLKDIHPGGTVGSGAL